MKEVRFSNIFIEKRTSSFVIAWENQGFFINLPSMNLQTPAEICVLTFDAGRDYCKNEGQTNCLQKIDIALPEKCENS